MREHLSDCVLFHLWGMDTLPVTPRKVPRVEMELDIAFSQSMEDQVKALLLESPLTQLVVLIQKIYQVGVQSMLLGRQFLNTCKLSLNITPKVKVIIVTFGKSYTMADLQVQNLGKFVISVQQLVQTDLFQTSWVTLVPFLLLQCLQRLTNGTPCSKRLHIYAT